jgi:hypothetical protein
VFSENNNKINIRKLITQPLSALYYNFSITL